MTAPTEVRRLADAVPHPEVLFVTSQGGHLAQLMVLQRWYAEKSRVWVAPPTPDVVDKLAQETWVASHFPTTRNLPNAVRNLVLAWRLLRASRPRLIVSTGAGVAVPFFVVAWLLRIPSVFVEVYDRLDSATMTGRLVGPFATTRIVQWEEQLDLYPDAIKVGPLL